MERASSRSVPIAGSAGFTGYRRRAGQPPRGAIPKAVILAQP